MMVEVVQYERRLRGTDVYCNPLKYYCLSFHLYIFVVVIDSEGTANEDPSCGLGVP